MLVYCNHLLSNFEDQNPKKHMHFRILFHVLEDSNGKTLFRNLTYQPFEALKECHRLWKVLKCRVVLTNSKCRDNLS